MPLDIIYDFHKIKNLWICNMSILCNFGSYDLLAGIINRLVVWLNRA